MTIGLIPRSIRNRMLMLSAVATLIALVIAGLVTARLFERFVTQGVDQRLEAQIALLATAVETDGQIDPARLVTLRGALDAGPGWQWRITAPGGSFGSDNVPAFDPRRMPPDPRHPGHRDPAGPRPVEGHDGDGQAIHARQLIIKSPAGNVLIAAAAPRAVIEQPIRAAILPLLLLLVILSAILGTASLLQVRYGLRPLNRLRDQVAAIRTGNKRAVSEDQPDELRPLALELNALAHDNAAALTTARASAANLAHALKTPVATLALGLDGNPVLARQVDRIDATIRHHLSRARSGVVDRHVSTPLAVAIADLGATIAQLNVDRPVALAVDIDSTLAVALDPADLDELMGNLIDNAMGHASSTVTLVARPLDALVRIAVIDDGPGIPAADRERAMAPGIRLDERDEGHGFGLAIARDLAALYGGSLSLHEADGGGLRVELALPRAAAQI